MSIASEGILFRMPIPRLGSHALHEPRYSWVEIARRIAAEWPDRYAQSGAVTTAGVASNRAALATLLTETSQVTPIAIRGALAAPTIPYPEQTAVTKPAAQAISLIDGWLTDTSGYDEETWPALKAALDRDRLSARRFFDDESDPT